jgi:hypothetical protein
MRHSASPYEREVVVRRIRRPLGCLPLSDDFTPVPSALTTTWRAPARLSSGHRVHVEVSAWSDHATELRVVPVARHLSRWGGRRQRRYFAAAHALADQLVARFVVTPLPAPALEEQDHRIGGLVPRVAG